MPDRFRPVFIRGKRDPRERFIDTRDQQIISKRQYYKERRGGLSNERFAAARAAKGAKNPMRRYQSLLTAYEEKRRREGYVGTRGALRREQELAAAKKVLYTPEKGDTGKAGYRYSLKKTQALVALGRISEAWLLEAGYVRGGGFSPRGQEHFTAA